MSTTKLVHQFEADLEPGTFYPRVRFNFDNGWSASLLICCARNRTVTMQASTACWPTGQHGTGKSELGPTEATADEAIAWIEQVRLRAPVTGEVQQAAA
jgi:hypothetical protein